jgi:hypothetical protein
MIIGSEILMQKGSNDKLLGVIVIMGIHHVVMTILLFTDSVGDITVKILTIFEGLLKICFCKFVLSEHPNHEYVFLVYHTNCKSKLSLQFICEFRFPVEHNNIPVNLLTFHCA